MDWIGEIPESWTTKKFKYFFETSKGLSITKENLSESGIPVISYGQVHSKYGVKVDSAKDLLPFVSEDYLKYKQALLDKGDYIFADTSEDIDGSGNFSTKLNDEGKLFAGYHTIIARLLDKKNNDFRYFMYLFDSEWFRNQIRNSVSGVKVFSITQAILKNTTVLIPSALTEQKAIADYLDTQSGKFDKAENLLTAEIDRLRAYKKSLIYETVTKGLDKTAPLKDSGVDWIGEIPVGWEVSRVKYFFDIFAGGDINESEMTKEKDEFHQIPVLSNSKDNHGIFGYSDKVRFGKDTVTVTGRGDVGFAEPRDYEYYPIIRLLVAVPKKKMDARFASYWINSADIDRNQTAVAQMTRQTLGEVPFPKISFEFQKQIADYLDEKTNKIDQIIKIKEQQLTNLSEQRKTLIYEVVTGKKRINETSKN